MPGDLWQKFANLRLLYAYMWTHPGKKLLFMGCDFGQWNEWNCDATLQWDLLQWDTHRGVQKLVSDLNALYRAEPALYELDFDSQGFEWIDCQNNNDCVLAYVRRAKDPNDFIVVALNLTPVPRVGYQLGVPQPGFYREVLNSDSQYYDGSNMGNANGAKTSRKPAQGREHSIRITLPPLAAVAFKPER